MSSPPAVRIVAATARDLLALQPLAEAVFADAPAAALFADAPARDPEWFRRKLVREAVDPRLSSLALGTGDVPVGYMLVGPGDRETGITHGAGLGLLPAWRGRGIGPALVEATAARLQAAGISAVHLLADPNHHAFYRRVGFIEVAQRQTMGATGTGTADIDLGPHPPRPWLLPGVSHAQWSAGTWERTTTRRAAVLVHRLALVDPSQLTATLHDLRSRFAAHTPVLLYGCDPVSCVTVTCLATGWQVLQHAHVMERRFW